MLSREPQRTGKGTWLSTERLCFCNNGGWTRSVLLSMIDVDVDFALLWPLTPSWLAIAAVSHVISPAPRTGTYVRAAT